MWNASGWYGFVGTISTSATDISLKPTRPVLVTAKEHGHKQYNFRKFKLANKCLFVGTDGRTHIVFIVQTQGSCNYKRKVFVI